jgi:hypothetical protein
MWVGWLDVFTLRDKQGGSLDPQLKVFYEREFIKYTESY